MTSPISATSGATGQTAQGVWSGKAKLFAAVLLVVAIAEMIGAARFKLGRDRSSCCPWCGRC